MKKKVIVSIIAYVLFGLELVWIFSTLNVCPFEHDVDEVRASSYHEPAGQYEYLIENLSVDEEDIYKLVKISGWIIQIEEDAANPVRAEIVLDSTDKGYKLKTYSSRRTDLYQLGQMDPKTGNLDAGFYGKYPEQCFAKGSYKVGFLLEEGREKVILWTDSILEL